MCAEGFRNGIVEQGQRQMYGRKLRKALRGQYCRGTAFGTSQRVANTVKIVLTWWMQC